MSFTFSIPEEEHYNVRSFMDTHRHPEVKYRGAIGGGIVYSFMGTSIGTICTVECPICHEKQDVSGLL